MVTSDGVVPSSQSQTGSRSLTSADTSFWVPQSGFVTDTADGDKSGLSRVVQNIKFDAGAHHSLAMLCTRGHSYPRRRHHRAMGWLTRYAHLPRAVTLGRSQSPRLDMASGLGLPTVRGCGFASMEPSGSQRRSPSGCLCTCRRLVFQNVSRWSMHGVVWSQKSRFRCCVLFVLSMDLPPHIRRHLRHWRVCAVQPSLRRCPFACLGRRARVLPLLRAQLYLSEAFPRWPCSFSSDVLGS